VIIFGYYLIATLLPIDKIIGKIYPIFGSAILIMAVLMLFYIFDNLTVIPEITSLANTRVDAEKSPIFPMLFMTLSCGALSGFHATQSPLMARCLTNESYARPVFYGSMILEGIVALIWAGAAIAFTGSYEGVYENLAANGNSPAVLIKEIVLSEYGMVGYLLVMLGVVFAPISSGDTAMRCGRLIIADMLNLDQKSLVKRLLVSLPLFGIAYFIMNIDFTVVWQYFSWFNQILAMMTLWALTIYLAREGKFYFITLLPALLITMAVITYIFFQPIGLNMGYDISVMIAGGGTVFMLCFFFYFVTKIKRRKV
ncbi:MAG: carbon starvation CstA 5TM domain-containing protein, partial [Bacteroidales bacterium]